MIPFSIIQRLLIGSIFTGAFVIGLEGGSQAGQTDWKASDERSKARLVFASPAMTTNAGALAALEIKLAPEWKTYWRSPGEAGLPARVAINGEETEIFYPLPKPIVFYGIKTFGYADLVALPFRISEEVLQTGADITISYMVCKDICVPIEETFSVTPDQIAATSPAVDIALATWLKKVPARDGSVGVSFDTARIVGRVNHQRLVLDGRLPDGEEDDMLIVEADGFTMGNVQRRVLPDGEVYRYIVPMKAQVSGTDLKAQKVRVTLVAGPGAGLDQFVLKGKATMGSGR